MNIKNVINKFPAFFPYKRDDEDDKKGKFLKIRSDSRTPLGKASLFDKGSASIKNLEESLTI